MKVTIIFEGDRATGPNPEVFFDVTEEPSFHAPSGRFLISCAVNGKQVDRWIKGEDIRDLEVRY